MVFIQPANSNLTAHKNYSKNTFSFLKRSFVTPSILRKYPILSSLHRSLDGALVGVIFSGAFMTSVALHSQHLWTVNFSRLQLTRDLIYRLEQSTAILERHFIKSASSPNSMVATKSTHLLYLNRPQRRKTRFKDFLDMAKDHFAPAFYPITNGY